MVNGSVFRPKEIMNEKDSMNAFLDGARRACFAARELAKELQNPDWETVAVTLECMAVNGQKLFHAKSMSRLETLMAAQMKIDPYKPH